MQRNVALLQIKLQMESALATQLPKTLVVAWCPLLSKPASFLRRWGAAGRRDGDSDFSSAMHGIYQQVSARLQLGNAEMMISALG